MQEYYLENRGNTADTEHQKFYRINLEGLTTVFTWGAIGAKKPGREEKAHGSEAEARAYADAKLKSKRKGGYSLISERNAPAEVTASPTGYVRETQHEERPVESGRRFGFEVETHSNLDPRKIAQELSARSLKINYRAGDYFHSDGKSWDVKRDGSCGYEFASPILRSVFDVKLALEKIRKVCEKATNAACGIHVTVDVSDHSEADVQRLIWGYLKAQEHFYKLCNASRQDNRYCRRNSTATLLMLPSSSVAAMIKASCPEGRYHGFNLANLRTSHPRVEFRMLESTLDARKVGAWIRTCLGFVDGLKKSGIRFKTHEAFSEDTFASIVEGTWNPRTALAA